MQGDDEGVSIWLLLGGRLLRLYRSNRGTVLDRRRLVHDAVVGGDVEESVADVTRGVGLVTIEAEPLASALRLLCWC